MNFLHHFLDRPVQGCRYFYRRPYVRTFVQQFQNKKRLATEFSPKTRVREQFPKTRKRSFCVGEGFRNLERLPLTLGKAFEISKTLLSRWGSLPKTRKRSFCVGEAFRKLENAPFTLGKSFRNLERLPLALGKPTAIRQMCHTNPYL